MEFVEARDARVPINILAMLTLGAIRQTRGGISGTGCSNPTNMKRLAIRSSGCMVLAALRVSPVCRLSRASTPQVLLILKAHVEICRWLVSFVLAEIGRAR
jgi:hypothetical protein